MVPLVLRSFVGREYLFVGIYWLIESEIQNLGSIFEFGEDPGLPKGMTGRVCVGAKESDVKLFHIR